MKIKILKVAVLKGVSVVKIQHVESIWPWMKEGTVELITLEHLETMIYVVNNVNRTGINNYIYDSTYTISEAYTTTSANTTTEVTF